MLLMTVCLGKGDLAAHMFISTHREMDEKFFWYLKLMPWPLLTSISNTQWGKSE